MASFTQVGDKHRAFVWKHGIRATKLFKTKREAQAWAIRKEAELDAMKGSGGQTLRSAADHYLKTVSVRKADSAHKWEAARFNYMCEHFGANTALAKITSAEIGQWRDKRLETVSGSTVNREAGLLRNLFTCAVDEWKWLQVHPFKGVRLPEENEARHQLWKWQEIRRVLRAGQRSGGKIGEVAKAFHIALRSGMRLKEVLLAPTHYDPVRRVVTVPTKTARRGEEIPIGRIAHNLLKDAKFTVGPNEASALFSRLSRSQMVQGMTFHDARATALTLLARKVDVMVLARISRHKDISLLHRVYYRTTASEIAAKI